MQSDLVAAALRNPAISSGWDGRQWSQLIQQARSAGLLARVLGRLVADGSGIAVALPAGVQGHAESAARLARAQQDEIRRELAFIEQALRPLGAPVVLLKGAAYVMADLPAAQGRIFSDIDIMVPKAALPQAEAMLVAHGWMSSHHGPYDQRYYRQWMHELPPMQHLQRGTTLDVHHAILPDTARLRPPSAPLFDAALALTGHENIFVLAPADMVLHSMTHLFMNDDMSHALRDMSDLDLLLGHFESRPGFWDQLGARAQELDLARPLYYGIRFTEHIWGRRFPDILTQSCTRAAPPLPLRALMDSIWTRALRAPATQGSAGTAAALGALYVRGHWLRMPPALLLRHLTIKALGLHREPESSPEPRIPDVRGPLPP